MIVSGLAGAFLFGLNLHFGQWVTFKQSVHKFYLPQNLDLVPIQNSDFRVTECLKVVAWA